MKFVTEKSGGLPLLPLLPTILNNFLKSRKSARVNSELDYSSFCLLKDSDLDSSVGRAVPSI